MSETPNEQPKVVNSPGPDPIMVKCWIKECINSLRAPDAPKSRELSLVVTKLQEATQWIDQHLMDN